MEEDKSAWYLAVWQEKTLQEPKLYSVADYFPSLSHSIFP